MATASLQYLTTFRTAAMLSFATIPSTLLYNVRIVLQRDAKFFTIDKSGRADTVSIDRLKPAHLDIDQPVQVAKPRRRGRPKKQATTNGSGGGPVEEPTTNL